MKSRKIYDEYANKLYRVTNKYCGKGMPENEVSNLFSELLSFLPNGGKLYKYRPLNQYDEDALTKKYLWFSSPQGLNDNKDCAFNTDILKETKDLVKFVLKDDNYRKVLTHNLYLELSKNNICVSPKVLESCVEDIANSVDRIGKLKFKKFCKKHSIPIEMQKIFGRTLVLYKDGVQGKKYAKDCVKTLSERTEKIRNDLLVCSLTTSYKKDSMWAYYANNSGICIEYDFTKIKSSVDKVIFVATQKVRYGKKKKFSYIDVIKAQLDNTLESLVYADKLIMAQYLTKDKSWSTEEEWRVILSNSEEAKGYSQPIDMISAIYIDYSVLKKRRTRRIIQLAKENGWGIYVRYYSQLEAEYRYDTLERTQELIKKIGQN